VLYVDKSSYKYYTVVLQGSFANTGSTVIPLFIWNVYMQLLYIKLSAVIYATLLNFQSPFSQFQQ